MDIRTGRTYDTKDDAVAAGVPLSDIAEVSTDLDGAPLVRFETGPFKGRVYRRIGKNLVRVRANR